MEIHATLLDEGAYLCSPRTMYRILDSAQEVKRHSEDDRGGDGLERDAGVVERARELAVRAAQLPAGAGSEAIEVEDLLVAWYTLEHGALLAPQPANSPAHRASRKSP